MRKGKLFVVSAPSGAGKSTVLSCVRKRVGNLDFSISCTTRAARQGEADGIQYHFIDRSEFKRMIEENRFLEWAEVHGEFYGTPRAPIEDATGRGRDVILDIDVQGGMAIKKICPDAVTIFILPPDMEELKSRLGGRATESPEQIKLRLANAKAEMRFAGLYDHRVVNDKLDQACLKLCSLIEDTRKQ